MYSDHCVCDIFIISDPLCVVQNYHENIAPIHAASNAVGSVLTKTGSLLPFYEGLFLSNWAERVAFEFFEAYLQIESEKKK